MSGQEYRSHETVDDGQIDNQHTSSSSTSSSAALHTNTNLNSNTSTSASVTSPSISKRRRFEDEIDSQRRERPDRTDNEHDTQQQQRHEDTRRNMMTNNANNDTNGTTNNPSSSVSANSSTNTNPGANQNASSDDKLELRLLIEGPLVGAIIGRQGATIKKLREDFGAFINILQDNSALANPHVKDRVMVIRAPMNIIHSTLSNLLDVIHESLRVRESRAANSGAANAVNEQQQSNDPSLNTKLVLLVHRTTVGAIIGKAGDTIKNTAAETGARVQVSPETLPNSTEKSVALIGNKSQVLAALERVMNQIKNAVVKTGQTIIPYQPQQQAVQSGMAGQMINSGHLMQQSRGSGYGVDVQQQAYYNPALAQNPGARYDDRRGANSANNYGNNYSQQAAPQFAAPLAVQQGPVSEQKIAIPSICAGCVIGRGGEVIKQLRMQSGCAIQVENPDQSNPTERVVVINGTQQAIQTAVRLIRQCVENFKPPTR